MNQAPRSKVLDFGCGVGRILGQLTTGHDCYGVEVNGRAAKVAQARGITVIPESALSERTESGFDFVILSDVFEHLPAPFSFLRLLAGALKPGGALIISSGNGDAVLRSEYLAHFWYFRVMGHLQMFSPRNLEWCAGRLGLELTECHRTSHYAAPLKARCRQQIQTWAFEQFHIRPKAWLTGVARWVPGIRRAEHWPLAPALTCTPDHLVAVFRKK